MPKDYDADLSRHQHEAEVVPAPGADEEAPVGGATGGGKRRARLILALLATALLGAGAWYGHSYWTVGRFMVTTDDAYVHADFATLAPKITGYVVAVPAQESGAVRAGEPLVRLEDGDYRDALALAEAQLAAQEAAIVRIDRQAAVADASVAQSHARVEAARAALTQASADLARYRSLAANDVASAQRLEAAQAQETSARAAVREAEAGVATAEANRAVIDAQRAEAQAMIGGLAAAREKARRDLEATVIRAPFDGIVGNLSVAVGDLVAPGKRLLAVVPLDEVYVEANFKETQIAGLAPGTAVHLHVDAFPDRDIVGRVEGVSPASGAQFSLLPPENATGNFTKIVQRVPVRVAVPADVAAEGWLRPGLSVEVSADTRTTPAPASALAAR
jgi:membrane fusion protein (multidrug efflux system)